MSSESNECNRHKRTVLSFNISWEYILVIKAFWKRCIFFFHILLFIPPLFTCRSAISSERWINLKLLLWFGKTPSKALKRFQKLNGINPISCISVFEWHKLFKYRHEEVKDEPKIGRLLIRTTKVNVEWKRQSVYSYRQLMVYKIICKADKKKESVWKIIAECLEHVWKVRVLDVLSIPQFLVMKYIAALEHPLCSFHIARWDIFFLFPKLDVIIKETGFENDETIKRAVAMESWSSQNNSFSST